MPVIDAGGGAKSAKSFEATIDSEVLLHGEDHAAVARARSKYGEWLLNEGDIGAARYQLECAYRIQGALSGPGVITEDLVDAHYRVGRAIAAESRVTGSNSASKAHFLKTLAMREDYDAKVALDRVTGSRGSDDQAPTLSSAMDSTLIYADLAETERVAGNYKDASLLYLKSLKLRRSKFGDVSAPVAQVLVKYGDILRLSLKYNESKAAIEEALAIYMHIFGPKHVQTTEAMNNLGQMQRLLGSLEEAEALLLESLNIRREMHGDFHVSTASSLNNLAEVCREKEDFFQAINYHNAAIDAFAKAVGFDHPGTMNAKGNLGVTLRRQAKQSSDMGQVLVREAMDYLKAQQYDAEHPWMAKFDTEHAMAQAEHLAAEGRHEESLQLYEALINKKHIVAQLTSTVNGAGGNKMAASTASQAAGSSKRAAQDVVLLTEGKVQALMKRAHMLESRHKMREAGALYRSFIEPSRKVLGLDNLLIFRASVAHGMVLLRLAQYDAAAEVIQEALQARIDLRGPDDVEVTEASYALAEVFRISANFDGASALYVHCMEVLSEALRKDPFSKEKSSKSYPLNERYVLVTLGLAKVQASKCVITKARTLLSQAKETAARTLGEEHALYCDIEFLEADLHFECGNYTEAVAAHKACLAKRVAIGSHKVYSSLHQLARISLGLCDFPRAAGYLDESLGLVTDLFSPSSASGGQAEAEGDDLQQQQHPSILRLLHTKAQLLLATGSYAEAHQLIESTMVSRRIALGARHNRVADSLVVLAQLAHARGLQSLARQPLEDALDVYRDLFVYDMHKQVCTCRVELAVNAIQGGRYSQAVEMLQDVRDKRIEFFNKMGVEKHIEIAQASALLSRAVVLSGGSLEVADKLASEAGAMLASALELSSPPHDEGRFAHLLATDCLEALAAVATARGRYKDSRALLSHSLALRNNALPPTYHSLCALFLQAVENNTHTGYCAASQSVAARVADHVGTHFGKSSTSPSHSSLFVAQARLMQARLLLLPVAGLHYNNEKRQEAAAAAEPLLAQALTVVRDCQGEDNVLFAQITAEMGACMQARGKDKFVAADQLLRQALAVLTRLHNAPMHIHCIEVQLRIAALLVERVLEEEALPLLNNQIIPALSEYYSDEHPLTIYAKGLLGVCLNDKKKGSGLENVRTSLLQLEDYGQGPFPADHPFVLRVGGFETSAKSRTSDSAAMQVETYQPLAHWAFPQLELIEQTDEEKRVAALYASEGGEAKPLTRSFFPADAPVPEAEAVQVLESEGWGSVGSRRRGNVKGKREPPVLGALFRPLLATSPPYSIGSGDCSALAVGILRGAVPVSQEAIYGAAASSATPPRGASSPFGAESKQRVRGAFGKLQQMAAENAAKEAAAEAEEEKGVRSKLSEVRQELEAEEARLADVRLQKVAEEAETEELRQAREQEEAEIEELAKQKKAEELAIVSLLTRKETEAAEAAVLTAAREKHERDLARVADELMAKMEEVAQAEETLKKLRAKHVSVQAMPTRAEGDEGSLTAGGDNDEQSVVSIPSAVAVVVSDEAGARSSSPQQVPTADEVLQPSGSGSSGSSSRPKALSEGEQKRAQALDAAAFMLARASELLDAGWFLKARPMLEECVRIRAKHLMLQPGHLDAMYVLALNLVLCDDYHAAFPLIEEALKHRVEQHAKRATKSKEGEEEGEEEESNGAKMIDETQSKHTIEIAELTQLQAWNYLCVGKYLKAGAKMGEAVKMFIELVGDAHHKTGRCFAQQAYVLARLGRFDEAKAVAERSFSILNKVYGTKDAATTLGMMARVHVAVACGRNKEAKPLLEQCISMRKRLCGEQHPLTAECFSYLGQTLMQQSRLSEAERWFDQAREALVSRSDDHSLAVADVDYHKAQMLIIYGRLGEAAALLQRVLERRRKWLPLVLDPEEIAANTPKVKTEEELDAEADLELKTGKKAEPFKPKQPVTHSGIQDCLESLGRVSLLLGELSKAEAAFKEVGRLRKEYCTSEASTDGTVSHPDLAGNFFWKAECARVLGLYEQARPIHELASEMRQKSLGKEHLDSLQSAAVLANLQAGSGLLEEADKSYKRILKRIKECLSDDHHLYADVQCAHADCLRRLGRLEKARQQLDDSTAARRMLFGEKNPDHLAFVEAANNNALLEMDELLAPPPPPVQEDQEANQTTASNGPAAAPPTEEDEAEAAELQALQVKSKQQARIAAQADDDETVVSSLPPADRAATDDLDDEARQTLLLEQAQAIEEGGGVEEEKKEEEAAPEPFSRDAQGVPLFDNSAYEGARLALRAAIATLAIHYTPFVPGSDATQHLWTLNLQGNIGIVTKLEWEELQRFLFSLNKEDRKAFRRRERRLAKLAALAQKSAALVQADNASTFTEAPASATTSADAPAPAPAPDSGASTSADSAQPLGDDGDDDEDEEGEESQKKKKAEPELPPGTSDIETAIVALQARGMPAVHPWITKFLSYRVVVEPPPDELGISLLLLDEAALLSHKGFFSAADLKLDEALSLLIDFLGDVKAETNAEVARCITLRAQSALTQNRLDSCKKGFMQAYYMFCKIENPECEGACKCLFGLAELLRLRGLSEDSKLLHERVLRLRTALFGSSSIEVATSQASLSLCLADLGALPEALVAANKAVATCEAFKRPAVGFEDDYLYSAQARLVLGRVLLARGELPDASEQLKAALELQVGGLGADHVRSGDFLHALAELRFCQCKLLDARKLVGQALKIRLKTQGRVRYLDVKLKAAARAFLDKTPEQDDNSLGGEEGFGTAKRLLLVKGAPAPSAADAFGGRATLDADLGSLIASSVESITGSAASVASSRLSVKEEKKKGFYWRGNAVYSHTLLADTLHLRGDICLALGDLKEAREMIEGAYAVRSDLFGKRAVPSAKSLAQMAGLVAYLGVPAEALSLYTIAYHLRLQLLGDAHPDVGDSCLALGRTRLLMCRLDESAAFLQDAKAILKASVGAAHHRHALVLAAEAELLLARADYLGATSRTVKALEALRATFRDVHPSIASVLLTEGRVCLCQGVLDVAQVKIEQAISQRGVFYGDGHVAVAEAKHWAAHVLREQGRVLEAKPLVESVLLAQRDQLGKHHHDTVSTLTLLAFNMLDLGKYSEASPVFERAAQLLRRSLGEDTLQATWALYGLGEAKLAEANWDKSRDAHTRASAARKRMLSSEEHPLVLQSRHALTLLDVRLGRVEEATKALDDLLALRRMSDGQMHPDVATTLFELGEVLRLRGKLTEARSMHERALKMRRTVLGVDHPAIVDSQLAIAQIFVAFGRLEQGAAMIDRCLSNYRLKRGSRHPSVARSLLLLGQVHLTLANYEASRAHLLDALMLRKSTFLGCFNHPDVAECVSALGDWLRATGSYIDTAAFDSAQVAAQPPAALTLLVASAVELAHTTIEQQQQVQKKAWGAAALGSSGSLAGTPWSGNANEGAGGDDASVVSGVSGPGNDGPLQGGSVSQLDVAGASIGGLSRSVASLPFFGSGAAEGGDNKSVDVETVHVSRIEERLSYVSLAEFLDDGQASLQETGGVARPLASPLAKGQSPTSASMGGGSTGKESGRGDGDGDEESRQGDYEEEQEEHCMPLYERALDMVVKKFGLHHPRALAAQHDVALTLLLLGHLSLAHDLLLHVVIERRAQLGDEHLDTAESCAWLCEALRLMSRVFAENTAEAAEKRKNPKVDKALGPSLIQHLASILGPQQGLKRQWPPAASSALVLLDRGKTTTETMHPLLSPPKRRISKGGYQGGFQGYAYPQPKKIKRVEWDSRLTRPPKTFYHDAKWVLDVGAAGAKRALGDVAEHPLLSQLTYCRAELMRARRRPDQAIPLFEEALSVRRQLFRASHPAIADCLVGLAEIYRVDNKFSRSQPLLEKALEIRSTAFARSKGGGHASVGEVQCSLAMLLFSLGQYVDAEPLFAASLATRERLLGASHVATAQTLNNFAGLLHTLGRFDEALPMYRRVVAIKTATFGEGHPDVASSQNNLALLLKAMGQLDEAHALYTSALSSQQRVFGEAHTDVAATLNNLAALEAARSNEAEAKVLYRQSLEIKRKVLGMDHPSVASTLNNLAGLCMACGDMEDAKDLYEDSLRVRRAVFGDDHPSVAESLNNIALLLFAQGQYPSALPLFERAIVIKAAAFGDAHVSTAASMHNLAIVLHKLRRFAEADAMYARALSIRSERLGLTHADTAATLSAIQELGRDRDRLGSHSPVLEQRQLLALEKMGAPLPSLNKSKDRVALEESILRAQQEEAGATEGRSSPY